MHKLRILILYPDPAGLALLTSMLKSLGHIIEEAANDRIAVRLMERENIDLVLAGVDPADGEALELLTYVRRKHREVPVVLLFPRLHPERAKEALRLGAMAVLKYPVPAAELRAAVLQALEQCEARISNMTPGSGAGMSPVSAVPASSIVAVAPSSSVAAAATATARGPAMIPMTAPTMAGTVWPAGGRSVPLQDGPAVVAATASHPAIHALAAGGQSANRLDQVIRELGLIGNDSSWRQVIELAATIAPARSPVLIAGEPGTGKSLLARLIHALGSGPDRPFIVCEAASLADELETEDPEAAPATQPVDTAPIWAAKVNLARAGTFFLDDVAALPVSAQLHLLRDLQFRDYSAVAGHASSPGDVRFIMSTADNLPALIEQGRFRQELYHRISVVMLTPPPLRHRGTDIELLAEAFRARYAQEFRKAVTGFTRDALDILKRHDWPGNVRELEAAIQRAVAMCTGPRISSSHLAPILNHHRQGRGNGGTPKPHLPMGIRPLKEALEEPEKRIIIQALQAFNWNRQETARVLDINRTTLYKKMKKYGLLIDEPMWVQ